MKIVDKIIEKIKKIFKKDKKISLDEPFEKTTIKELENVLSDSIKVELPKKHSSKSKNNIKVKICEGDGTGIKPPMTK